MRLMSLVSLVYITSNKQFRYRTVVLLTTDVVSRGDHFEKQDIDAILKTKVSNDVFTTFF